MAGRCNGKRAAGVALMDVDVEVYSGYVYMRYMGVHGVFVCTWGFMCIWNVFVCTWVVYVYLEGVFMYLGCFMCICGVCVYLG